MARQDRPSKAKSKSSSRRNKHGSIAPVRYECPLGACDKTFSTKAAAKRHAKEQHYSGTTPPKRHKCPEDTCDKTFSTKGGANVHAKVKHYGRTFVCDRCQKEFVEKRSLKAHIMMHAEEALYIHHCPAEGCDKKFKTEEELDKHARRHHYVKNIPCTVDGCDKKFFSFFVLRDHVKVWHEENPYSCPTRDETGCEATFATQGGAKTHVKVVHEGVRFPCPLATDFECDRMFTQKSKAQIHADHAHRGMGWECPLREKIGCNKVFASKYEADAHGRGHEYRLRCRVPLCVRAVSGQPFYRSNMKKHMDRHRARGHVEGLENYQPTEVRLNVDECIGDPDFDEFAGEDCQDDHYALDTQDSTDTTNTTTLDLEEEDVPELLDTDLDNMKVRTKFVQDRNDAFRKRFKAASHYNMGNTCIGPTPVIDGMVSQLCPHKEKVNFTTAPLRVAGETLVLHGRCIRCHAQYIFARILHEHDLAAGEGQDTCSWRNCFHAIWHGTMYCRKHFREWKPRKTTSDQIARLQEIFQAATEHATWKPTSEGMKKVMELYEDIQSRNFSAAMLVFVDLEYNLLTGRIHEVAICDAFGRTIIDAFTELSDKERENTKIVPGEHQHQALSQSIGGLYEVQVRRRGRGKPTMTVEEIVHAMKEAGITTETYFVAWATNASDLTALRQWFEREEFFGVLPGDNNCVLPLHDYRANLRLQGQPKFPLRLPVAFPSVYGLDHTACGGDHVAMKDTRRLWYLFQAFVQLCQPPESRKDWRAVGGRRRTIDSYFESG